MNDTSSRSHAIFTIYLKQRLRVGFQFINLFSQKLHFFFF
eukprot:GSMAST32.ASY1.ANO1.520.1 assembled CDS